MTQKVLVIDDCRSIHLLIRARLRDEGVELFSASGGIEGLQMAANQAPDLILLDVEMPDLDGFEVCRRLKADPDLQDIPIIFLTGDSLLETKIRGFEAGAVDFVGKPFEPAELRARVRSALRTKYLRDLLAKKAMLDGLTGLWNRAYFDQRLAEEASRARRYGHPLACIMLDLDKFKSLNDQYGHPFGDRVIRATAQLLQTDCRKEDVVCRYGGEEFVVLAPQIDANGAVILAQRLCDNLASLRLSLDGQQLAFTASFGVAQFIPPDDSTLVQRADQALYAAKQAGRNRVSRAA